MLLLIYLTTLAALPRTDASIVLNAEAGYGRPSRRLAQIRPGQEGPTGGASKGSPAFSPSQVSQIEEQRGEVEDGNLNGGKKGQLQPPPPVKTPAVALTPRMGQGLGANSPVLPVLPAPIPASGMTGKSRPAMLLYFLCRKEGKVVWNARPKNVSFSAPIFFL